MRLKPGVYKEPKTRSRAAQRRLDKLISEMREDVGKKLEERRLIPSRMDMTLRRGR